ncbi:hypothetical protein RMSM_06040, partial [Rhodopirellula maiorica SM1]
MGSPPNSQANDTIRLSQDVIRALERNAVRHSSPVFCEVLAAGRKPNAIYFG